LENLKAILIKAKYKEKAHFSLRKVGFKKVPVLQEKR